MYLKEGKNKKKKKEISAKKGMQIVELDYTHSSEFFLVFISMFVE